MLRIVIGLAVIAATIVASHFNETIDLYRFVLGWAGVLIALDGLARVRRGRSPLATAGDWVACALASVVFWDLFELVDLRLKNWWYVGVSSNALAGGAFAAISFATVLPAIRLLLAAAGEPVGQRSIRPAPLLAAGFGMLALALAFPAVAFPLAWLFLWPICEALASLLPRRGLATPLESRVFWRLAVLGLPLGLIWESLNWGCRRGWVYTVPHFENWKIFEMPAPGYLGYLPFLLEATAALALLERLRPFLRGARAALAIACVLALHAGADTLARRQTVVSHAPYEAAGVAPEVIALERRTGMGLPRALRVSAHGWESLDDDPALVRVWRAKAAW